MEFHSEDALTGNLSLRVFGSPAALAQALAGRVKEAVMTGIRHRGLAMLWLDGGPVLRRSYEVLSGTALPWGSVVIATATATATATASSKNRAEPPPAAESTSTDATSPPDPAAFVQEVLCRDRAAEARLAPLDGPAHPCGSFDDDATAAPPRGADDPPGPACHDIVVLAMAADGSLPAWAGLTSAGAHRAGRGYRQLLDSRRIVIAAQGLRARDAFERQVLAGDAAGAALLTLSQECTQPLELCWCR